MNSRFSIRQEFQTDPMISGFISLFRLLLVQALLDFNREPCKCHGDGETSGAVKTDGGREPFPVES